MELRQIGKSGINASKICLGAWSIGGGPFWGGDSDDKESIKSIKAAVESGINFIDTAPSYGFGHSEKVVGKAIKGMRDKVIISSKCGLWWGGKEGTPFYEQDGHNIHRSLRPSTIRQELENSLKLLGTDYLDLYITHWPEVGDDATPIAETMNCLTELKKEGKIRAIGASNVSLEDIGEYSRHGQLDVIQERFTMLDRHLEPDYISLCDELDVSIMTYSTIEMGLLTGKIGMDAVFAETEWRNNLPWMKPENRQKVLNMLDGWSDLLTKYDCTLAQLVIAWTAAQKRITFPIVGARKVHHAKENGMAGDLVLDSSDITKIRLDAEALKEPVLD